ncbi:MAG: winged helix-turn-helix transcriptional regulator [Steroidobacteraceae bacterium]
MSIRNERKYFCPIDVTLSVLSGKWKPLLLFHLASGPKRFNELQSRVPHVSHKVLSQQLRQLELDELVRRHIRKTAPRAVSYELTELGRSLKASLGALAAWGNAHHRRLGVQLEWPTSRGT